MTTCIGGSEILGILAKFNEPTTLKDIVDRVAKTYKKKPDELQQSVLSALDAGVRYGFVQQHKNYYYSLNDVMEALGGDDNADDLPLENILSDEDFNVTRSNAPVSPAKAKKGGSRQQQPQKDATDDVRSNCSKTCDSVDAEIVAPKTRGPASRGKKKPTAKDTFAKFVRMVRSYKPKYASGPAGDDMDDMGAQRHDSTGGEIDAAAEGLKSDDGECYDNVNSEQEEDKWELIKDGRERRRRRRAVNNDGDDDQYDDDQYDDELDDDDYFGGTSGASRSQKEQMALNAFKEFVRLVRTNGQKATDDELSALYDNEQECMDSDYGGAPNDDKDPLSVGSEPEQDATSHRRRKRQNDLDYENDCAACKRRKRLAAARRRRNMRSRSSRRRRR